MSKLNKIFVLFILLSLASVDESYSQAEVSDGYNPLSLRQVHESYLLWKKTLWRRVDLGEKQNKPFFARNRELSKLIIEGVERGVLIPYLNDSVNDYNVMSREEFLQRITQDEGEEEDEFTDVGFEDDPYAALDDGDVNDYLQDILNKEEVNCDCQE